MKFTDICGNILNNIQGFADKILERIPEPKRRIFIFSLGGLVLLSIFLLMISLAGRSEKTGTYMAVTGAGIPHEELFYPAEPDFLPALMLERPPRNGWTAEDARPFWIDPAKDNEDEWRETAKAVIDRLMEGVQ